MTVQRVWYSESGMHTITAQLIRRLAAIDRQVRRGSRHFWRDDHLRKGVRYRENVPLELHQTTWCADWAIEFIERRHDGPGCSA